MKKILGIISIAIFTIALFVNINSENKTSSNGSLAGLVAINVANAESDSNGCDNDLYDQCLIYGQTVQDCDPSIWFHHCNQ